ncbi:MAG TPA: GDP-mannose 4,6-dehydratase [Acidobacteriota bacterium]|mgnify:CR=1 FL=1|nr:GDP-mannose 4,6-dehydratase [Acidobacteriota bacterium]
MARYLVTGAAGFIASKVCELLLADGHEVVGIDNLNDAYDVRLKMWRLDQLRRKPGFTFVKLDIADCSGLRATLSSHSEPGFDAVFNLAARAGVRQSVENPWVYVETNVTGTLNLLELARDLGIRKFLLASTSSLYGNRNPMPFSETAVTDYPLSPYAASKKGAEALCYSYHHLYGIDITVFRYFTVYGPAGRPDMSLFRFVQWISEDRPVIVYGDGQQSRDFTYVEDIARGTILGVKKVGYEIINLGSDSPAVLADVITEIEKRVGKTARIERLPMQASDVRATWADISKAERLLGWRPQVSLQEGLDHVVQWYNANRDWVSEIQTD